ncbi:nitroreductase/quinone reductase family protein [Allonocardiopsis opalescens]|uniref:Deazaflavin-dependent oxidoreductase (Nitroreductase family) n=1 Tax=Allonocardiopsis opalescens TaxID=1144618 RepID=A0A2T0Q5C4_9ACTN|nr:nitroreductase/quinone reductase family protein [Allonocardiopsis opalescens]PRX98973.1 deazaflavin-dependent oxidoreductase (nitroreductase family) [Allonocardiopsis opalescens]
MAQNDGTGAASARPDDPREFNRRLIAEFRANGGRVGGMFAGSPLLLLTTTGARTGRPHTTPAAYLAAGERWMVAASNGGADEHPAWYRNLLARPQAVVEVGDGTTVRSVEVTATVLSGERRDAVFARIAEHIPAFAGYQAGTERVIPVVALAPAPAADASRGRALAAELVRIHAGLRAELARLREAAEAPEADGAAGASARLDLRGHCLTYCEHLHAHHGGEDAAGFPIVLRHFPELEPAIERLREEHRVVAKLTAELRALVEGAAAADPVRLRADLGVLAARLEEHFDHEERELLAALEALPDSAVPGGG